MSLFDAGDLRTRPKHPARFSPAVVEAMRRYVPVGATVLDPFAGVGGIHALGPAVGNELELEWAAEGSGPMVVGNARHLPIATSSVECVATSPAYANRMSDHHNARDGSYRRTYRHVLGRELSQDNAGAMQWGPVYRELHEAVWAECWRVLISGGTLIVNVADHHRRGERIRVTAWHRDRLMGLGFVLRVERCLDTAHFRFGANRERYPERLFVLVKP